MLCGSREFMRQSKHKPASRSVVHVNPPHHIMPQFPEEQSETGEFQRQEDAFRDWVTADGSSGFPAVAGRYHLYISLACPWAHRTFIVRHLLGLEDTISCSVVDPVRDDRGWAFREGPGFTKDPINGFHFLSETYAASNPSFDGRVTVPVLWDKQEHRIVNNSEDDVCRMFADAFVKFRSHPCDLFPAALSEEQSALSAYVYENINNGVYRAGFADRQAAYEKAARAVFAALDQFEERLASRRYLFGPNFVETDWRLFCTLIRFDPVYHGHFKCNVRRILDYPNLSSFLRDLYQQPGIAATVNFDHIKRHYYYTHDDINPTRIVPIGPDLSWLDAPHDRARLI
jgi:glutathionyl-hydroquinone reductase